MKTLILLLVLLHSSFSASSPVYSRHLEAGLAQVSGRYYPQRRIFESAIACGARGELFLVTRTRDRWIQKGLYLLLTGIEPAGPDCGSEWHFLSDDDLLLRIQEMVRSGQQVALYSPKPVRTKKGSYLTDAIVFPPDGQAIHHVFGGKLLKSQPILVLTPRTDRVVFAHELKHLADYRIDLPGQIHSVTDRFLDEASSRSVVQFILELRAHAEEMRSSGLPARMSAIQEEFRHFYLWDFQRLLKQMRDRDPSLWERVLAVLERFSDLADWEILGASRSCGFLLTNADNHPSSFLIGK